MKKVVCALCGAEGKFKNLDDMADRGWSKIALGHNDAECDKPNNPHAYHFCENHEVKDMVKQTIWHAASPEKQREMQDELIPDTGRIRALKQRKGMYNEICSDCGGSFFYQELTYFSPTEKLCKKCKINRMPKRTPRKKKKPEIEKPVIVKKDPQMVLDTFEVGSE